MNSTKTLLVAAVAAACMAATAYAQNPTSRSASGARASVGGNFGGGRVAHSGSWSGHRGGGHWGGHRHHFSGARWGFFFGAPILWSAAYWGWPYYGYSYYPYSGVIYRDVERYPMSYPEGVLEPAPTTDIGPRSEGAPRQGPLYMNYCDSAKAYFPKVTSCPEGWKMISPTQ